MDAQWPTGSGVLLHKIRRNPGIARARLVQELGWARATVGKRLEELLTCGLIEITGQHESTGGRRAEAFSINPARGVVLAADIGSSHSRLAIADMAGDILIDDEADILIDSGPEEFFEWAEQVFAFMLERIGRTPREVLAVGIGVPDPVDPTTGILHSPASRTAWTRIPLADYVRSVYPTAVVAIERDANLLAIVERRLGWPEATNLALVKFSSGLGSGLVVRGKLYHGSKGTAGNIGSVLRRSPLGSVAPLDTFASGWSIQAQLESYGYNVRTSADIVALANSGDEAAQSLITTAARALAEASLDLVKIVSPEVLIVSGTFAETGNLVLSPFQDVFTTAQEDLPGGPPEIALARIGRAAGVRGAALTGLDRYFDADRISALTAHGLPPT